jgi:hypothetical protein
MIWLAFSAVLCQSIQGSEKDIELEGDSATLDEESFDFWVFFFL